MPGFPKFNYIDTDKLYLDRVESEDIDEVDAIQSYPGMEKTAVVYSRGQLVQYLNEWDEDYKTMGRALFFIRERESFKKVGLVGLRSIDKEGYTKDDVELGFARVLPETQGKGYSQTAWDTLTDIAFNQLGAKRVHGSTRNSTSAHIFEKMGFTHQVVRLYDAPSEHYLLNKEDFDRYKQIKYQGVSWYTAN